MKTRRLIITCAISLFAAFGICGYRWCYIRMSAFKILNSDFMVMQRAQYSWWDRLIHQIYYRTGWENIMGLMNISGVNGGGKMSSEAMDALLVFSEANTVCLSGCELTQDMCRKLSRMRNIEYLDISINEVGDETIGFFRVMPKLKELNLSRTAVTGRCFDDEWKSRHLLQTLLLSSTLLDWQGLNALKQFDNLASLEVEYCPKIIETCPEDSKPIELARTFARLVDLRGVGDIFRERAQRDEFVRAIPTLKTFRN